MREGEPRFENEPFLAGETLRGGEFSMRELKDSPDKVVRTESMVGSIGKMQKQICRSMKKNLARALF